MVFAFHTDNAFTKNKDRVEIYREIAKNGPICMFDSFSSYDVISAKIHIFECRKIIIARIIMLYMFHLMIIAFISQIY